MFILVYQMSVGISVRDASTPEQAIAAYDDLKAAGAASIVIRTTTGTLVDIGTLRSGKFQVEGSVQRRRIFGFLRT